MGAKSFSLLAGCLALLIVSALPFTPPASARTPDEVRAEADRHMLQGLEHFRQGRHQEMLRSWQQALGLYRSIGDRARQGHALENLGTGSLRLGDPSRARDYLLESLDMARERQDRGAQAKLLDKLGQAYRLLGEQGKAIQTYELALGAARAARDLQTERTAAGNLGLLYEAREDYDRATAHFQHALSLARQVQDRADEGAALSHLGDVSLAREDYVRAVESFQQVLVIARELRDGPKEIAALAKLGNSHYLLGDYARATDYLGQSLERARASGDGRAQSDALGSLGSVHYLLGDFKAAITLYEQALELTRKLGDRRREGKALGNLALAHTKQGRHRKAIELLEQDLGISRQMNAPLTEGQALTNLGTAYHHLGDYGRAVDYYQQSLTVVRAIRYRRGEGIALTNMGQALHRAGKLDLAERTLRDAIAVLESLRTRVSGVDAYAISLFETHLRAYDFLQATLVARGDAEAALEIAERGRARALVELMSRRASPAAASRLDAAPPSLAHIREAARLRQATLVEYSLIPEESALLVWVVQPSGQVRFRHVDLKPLAAAGGSVDGLVARARLALGAAGRGAASTERLVPEDERVLKELHEILIEPVAGHLPADPAAPVLFIPQGSLFLVPFAALLDRTSRALVDRHSIAVSPSIHTLQLARARRSAAGPRGWHALVVGNPTMPWISPGPGAPPIRLRELPGAEREAAAISALLGTRAITGDRATKPAVLAGMREARIIHLATHGLLDDPKRLGTPGAIALAPSPGDDGLLTAPEILDLELAADLVVLSACDTGRGRISGDGVIGLSRSVIGAGVPSVVVSLWEVPDAPTAELMTAFHRHLQREPSKARALRQAMLETRRRHPHPADWAAFVLVGEAR
jgi:CHAT domain-containing protein/tetratricopeptide (TPR) repeat protein